MKEKQWSAWSGTAYKKQYWRKKKTERKIGKTSFRLKAKENLNQSLVENLSTKNRDKTQKNYRNQDMADLYFSFRLYVYLLGYQ